MMETSEETELCFPHLLNESCRKPKRLKAGLHVLISTVLSTISALTVILNLLVIISISHFRQLHTPTNLLLLSLAASDLLVGLLLCFQTLLIGRCWIFSDLGCVFYYILVFIVTSSSNATMLLISVDRYVAICRPLHYANRVTARRVTVCVCVCWFFSVFYSCFIMTDNLRRPGRFHSCSGECVVVLDYVLGAADAFLTFVAPLSVIMVLYLRVFVVCVSQARALRSHVKAESSGTGSALKSELKAARTLGIVVLVFLACIIPFCHAAFSGQSTLFGVTYVSLENWVFHLNSCLNPLIYAFCYPWFSKSIKFILTLKILCPESCYTNLL